MAPLTIYLITFNCACTLINPPSFARHLFDGLDTADQHTTSAADSDALLPDILVLSLQELAPIAHCFLGDSFLAPYLDAFKDAVRIAAMDRARGVRQQFSLVAARNIGMTGLMVFARDSAGITISALETAGVGVGAGQMGNKGAVGIRFRVGEHGGVLGQTRLTFVGAHLAPSEDAVVRRNQDWEGIVRGLVFTRTGIDNKKGEGEGGGQEEGLRDEQGREDAVPLLQGAVSEHEKPRGLYRTRSHVFVAGDLNYRSSSAKPSPDDIERFPQPTDPLDSANHHSKLLQGDQLRQQLRQGNTLHGFTESEIRFPPTYKLLPPPPAAAADDGGGGAKNDDDDDDDQWNWASHRWPSWCDRILYLEPTNSPAEAKMVIHRYNALPQLDTSDHRPVILSLSVPRLKNPPPADHDHDAVDDDDDDDDDKHDSRAPFPINDDWQSRRAMARKMELVVGVMAYLALTWQGNGLVLATLVGGAGAWMVVSSMI